MDDLYIQPGELRDSVEIQAATDTRDAAGQPVSTWAAVLTARAKIEGTNSRTFKDSFSANALAAQSTDVVTLRWPGASIDLKPGMRLILGDNTYLVQGVDNVRRRNRKVVLACMVIDGDSN
jgi:SPP1 family predicted phage head-tail adaptor